MSDGPGGSVDAGQGTCDGIRQQSAGHAGESAPEEGGAQAEASPPLDGCAYNRRRGRHKGQQAHSQARSTPIVAANHEGRGCGVRREGQLRPALEQPHGRGPTRGGGELSPQHLEAVHVGEHKRLQEIGHKEENYPAGRELAERDQLRRGEAPQVCGVSRGQRGQRNQGRLCRR